MNDQQRIPPIYLLIGGFFAIILLVVILMSIFSGDNSEPTYELNEETGREFYNDPNQAPETTEVQIVSLFKSEELVDYVYGDYFNQMSIKMSKYLFDNVSDETKLAYVDSAVTINVEQQIVFEFKTTEPIDSRHRATIFITPADTVDATFEPL